MSHRGSSTDILDNPSFQDVISSTLGILLLITLILTLTITVSKVTAGLEAYGVERTRLESDIENRTVAEKQIVKAEATLAELLQGKLEAQTHEEMPVEELPRKLILPSDSKFGKPVLALGQGNYLSILDNQGKELQRLYITHPSSGAKLNSLVNSEGYSGVIILVKPSAFSNFEDILSLVIDGKGKIITEFGLDIIPEDWEVSL